jgi:hypothetical protein
MKRNHGLLTILFPAIILTAANWGHASEFQIIKVGDSVVDSEALTIDGGFGQSINGLSFQQDAVVTCENRQYVAYYDGGRRVCIARRELPRGEWEVVRFEDYNFQSNDAHNIISLGICPRDGTIHLAFDHHGHSLHYRSSKKDVAKKPENFAWEPSLFGPILSELETDRPIAITYPRFLQTPNGGLHFCYRQGGSGNGDRMLVDYDPKTGTWSGTRQIDSRRGTFVDEMGESAARCSYPNGYDYGPNNRLHATWVWRESSQGANHDLMYAYSEDGGVVWRNNQGAAFDDPPYLDSPGLTVVEIPQNLGLMNTHGQAVDSQGRVHVVMWHCSEESLREAGSRPGEERWGPAAAHRNHHYWRDSSGEWNHTELPGVAGTRPKIFVDSKDNAYVIYSDAWKRGIFGREGAAIILAATAESQWTDWQVAHIEEGPFGNEMLIDPYRWRSEGVLSVLVQESPTESHQSTPLRILDFQIDND